MQRARVHAILAGRWCQFNLSPIMHEGHRKSHYAKWSSWERGGHIKLGRRTSGRFVPSLTLRLSVLPDFERCGPVRAGGPASVRH